MPKQHTNSLGIGITKQTKITNGLTPENPRPPHFAKVPVSSIGLSIVSGAEDSQAFNVFQWATQASGPPTAKRVNLNAFISTKTLLNPMS
jgi:hypothetical protein